MPWHPAASARWLCHFNPNINLVFWKRPQPRTDHPCVKIYVSWTENMSIQTQKIIPDENQFDPVQGSYEHFEPCVNRHRWVSLRSSRIRLIFFSHTLWSFAELFSLFLKYAYEETTSSQALKILGQGLVATAGFLSVQTESAKFSLTHFVCSFDGLFSLFSWNTLVLLWCLILNFKRSFPFVGWDSTKPKSVQC